MQRHEWSPHRTPLFRTAGLAPLKQLPAILILTISLLPLHLHAQLRDTTIQFGPKLLTEGRSSVRVVPGRRYDAGGLHRLFFGSLWRDLWDTPIDVPVLDMTTFAGGLTPLKRGGGFQTKSLRFKGANGHEYKFRSLDKDPAAVLPADLRESLVADIVQDFIATSNPVSMVVAVPIINAAGVINAEPQLVVLPDDERLGEYRETFGGLLGALEENPSEEADGEEGFAGAGKIVLTYKLFNRLEKDNDEMIDAPSYLTARLIDIFMGDWDRHTDQWKWGRFEEDSRKLWRPIPRDRDQAFCRYDGIIPDLVESYIPQIEGCSDHYPSLKYLTWSGRYTDNRFLGLLDRASWDSVARAVTARLTDSVIDYAVHRLPPAMYAKEGEKLRRMLIARRELLPQAAEEFYRVKSDVVDLYGSDKGEYADVDRVDDGHVRVSVYDLDREGRPKAEPLFRRLFDDDYTSEIRLYMLGGDDSVVVHGDVASSILVRVIGGKGRDLLIDRSKVDGYLFGILPIPDAETKTRFYDSDSEGTLIEGASSSIDRTKMPEPKNDVEKYEVPFDRGFEWLYFPWVNFTPDLGFFGGASATLTEYGFRSVPYRDRMTFKLGFATAPRRFKGEFDGDFRKVVSGARLGLLARGSGLEVLNFFGFGNRTARDDTAFRAGRYKVEQQQFLLRPTLNIPLFDRAEGMIGVEGKYIRTELKENTLLAQLQPYGIANLATVSGLAGVTVDTRQNTLTSQRGFYLGASGAYYPKLGELRESFTRAGADLRLALSAKLLLPVTVALRGAAEKIWGAHPYFESAFIGGLGSVRGYDRERFAGDASLLAGGELRVYLFKVKLLVPMHLGIFGFAEAGRVFLKGESTDNWHGAAGGGLWFTIADPANTISLSVARSPERIGFYLASGFAF
jgi:hypothetical protein